METKHNEVDQVRDVGGFVVDCYTEYGNYTNLSRHVPRLEDGLKPVYKRVILAALDAPKDKRIKTATLIGSTIGCFTGDTKLLDINNSRLEVRELAKRNLNKEPVYTLSYSYDGVPKVARVLKVWSRGDRSDLVKVTLDNGESFCCTSDHKILTWEGYKEASKLSIGTSLIPVVIESVPTGNTKDGFRRKVLFNRRSEWVYRLAAKHKDCKDESSKENLKTNIHHLDSNALNDYPSNLVILDEDIRGKTEGFYDNLDALIPLDHKVVSVEPLTVTEEVFDVMVDSEEHNFALAAGCVAKNCYHPHGDASVNDVVAQLVRAGVLVGKGNFGDKGMFKWTDFGPAAPRYTEVMLNPDFRAAVSKLLPYVPTHLNDLDNWEADYIPSCYPLSVSTGSFGIGIGLNVNIPAFDASSMVKAGYAALCNKPEPWKLLKPNYGLSMSDEDKETFWKSSKGILTYNFTVEPVSSGGLNGWYIKGDPSYVKPNFNKLFKLKDDWGKVVIRDESIGDEKKVFVARSKRIKTITDTEVEAEVRRAARVSKSFSLAVVYKGITRPITGGEWIKMCMMNYHELVKKFKQDSINKINFEIEVYTHFKEVADRILNTRQSYETIRKELHLSNKIVERIAGMKISTLRDLDPKAKLVKLEQDRKSYEELTTAKMLASYLQ